MPATEHQICSMLQKCLQTTLDVSRTGLCMCLSVWSATTVHAMHLFWSLRDFEGNEVTYGSKFALVCLSLSCSIDHGCPSHMLAVSITLEPTTFQRTTHGLTSDASDASKSPFTLMGFKSSTEISKVHRILGGIAPSRFATHQVGHRVCVLPSLSLCLSLSLSLTLSLSHNRL